jgi:hypothetical protein
MKMRVTIEVDFGRQELLTVPEFAAHLRLLAERPELAELPWRRPEGARVLAAWIVEPPRKGGEVEP